MTGFLIFTVMFIHVKSLRDVWRFVCSAEFLILIDEANTSNHFLDDEISYTDASCSEADGVIHYQRLPADDFKSSLEHINKQGVNNSRDPSPMSRNGVPASPIVMDSQPQKYTIDKKFVRVVLSLLWILKGFTYLTTK